MDGNNMNGYNGINNQNNDFNNISNEPVNLGNSMPNQNNTMNRGVASGEINNTNSNVNVTPNNTQSVNYGSMNNNIDNPTVGNFNGNMMRSSSSSYNSGHNDDFMFKKEKKTWPIVLIVIVLLVAGLLCGYYFVVMSPKNIMTKTIDSMYTKVDEAYKSIKDNQNSSNSKGVVDGNVTFTSKELNANLSADYYMGYDISNEEKPIAYFETNAKYNDKGPVNASFYVEDNIVYLLVKDIYSKAIGFDLKTLGNITGGNTDTNCIGSYGTNCGSSASPKGSSVTLNDIDFNVDDIKYLTDLVKNSLKNSINYDKVSKTIKTDSGLYFETIYNFDGEEQDNISKGIKNAIKNDDKALEILAKIYDTTKDEVKNSLNDNDDSLSSIKSNSTALADANLKVILHTGIIDNKLTYFEMSNDKAILTAVVNGEETTIELKENKDSKPVMSVKFDNNSLSGELNSDDGEYNKITFSVKTTNKNKNNEVTSSFAIYSSKDSSNPAFNITVTANDKPGEQMKSFDKTNVVMYDKLTENDMNIMSNNLIKLLDKLGIKFPTNDDNGTM